MPEFSVKVVHPKASLKILSILRSVDEIPCLNVSISMSNGKIEAGTDFIFLSDYSDEQKKYSLEKLIHLNDEQKTDLFPVDEKAESVSIPLFFDKDTKHKLFFVR